MKILLSAFLFLFTGCSIFSTEDDEPQKTPEEIRQEQLEKTLTQNEDNKRYVTSLNETLKQERNSSQHSQNINITRSSSGMSIEKATLVKIIKMAQEATELHHPNGKLVSAQYQLGICYKYGIGIKKDMTQAHYWINEAAKNGHARAKRVIRQRQR